jgi:hypothetical protein
VIGAEKGPILEKFLTQLNTRKEVARGDIKLCGAIITVDEHTGKAVAIERVQMPYPPLSDGAAGKNGA